MRKTNFLLRYIVNGVTRDIPLRIVESLEPSYQRSVIVKESATGDGGVSFDNGRLQLSLAINGELLASSNDDLMRYEKQLYDLMGSEVLLIAEKKFSSRVYSGFWYIQDFRPIISNISDLSMSFSMSLQEVRKTNVRLTDDLGSATATRSLVEMQQQLLGLTAPPPPPDIIGDRPLQMQIGPVVTDVISVDGRQQFFLSVRNIRTSLRNAFSIFSIKPLTRNRLNAQNFEDVTI